MRHRWLLMLRVIPRVIVLTALSAALLGAVVVGWQNAPVITGILGATVIASATVAETALRRPRGRGDGSGDGHRELLEERLRAIDSCPFDIDEFLRDHDAFYSQPGGITEQSNGQRVPRQFRSSHITVVGNHRRTTQMSGVGSDDARPRTVWVLGGSTVLCVESPDDWTLPSRLARHIGATSMRRVVNCGVSGATARNRIAYARAGITMERGDCVVLYFGVNEGKGLRGRRGIGPLALVHGLPQLLDVLGRRSHLARVARRRWTRFSRRDHRSLSRLEAARLRRECDLLKNNLASKGIDFAAVLQPNVCVASRHTAFGARVVELWGRQIREVMTIQYAEFRRVFRDVAYFCDLSHILDDAVDFAYVDWVHLAWVGNDRVAAALAAHLASRGGR
jgi:hypothetical protein